MAELYTPDQAYKLAVEHFQAERYAEAEHIFRQLVAVSNDHESLSYFFGMTCCQLGKVDEGVIWLRKTIDINPAHAQAYTNLGVALFKSGHLAEAEDSLNRALSIAPELLMGWEVLKQIAVSREDGRMSLRCMERIAALSAEAGDYLITACSDIIRLVNSEAVAIPDILEIMREGSWARPELFQLYLPFLQEEIPEEERQGLVNIFNKRIEELCLDGWGCLHLALLWRYLFNLGWYSSDEQLDPVCLPVHIEQLVLFSKNANLINGLLRYKLDSPHEWNERLFDNYILPLIKRSEEIGCDWALFPLDLLNSFVYAQQPHTEKQARCCFDKLSASYISKGIRFSQTVERIPIPFCSIPVVAFTSNMDIKSFAPMLVIEQILRGWFSSPRKSFTPLIIGFGGITENVKDFLDRCRVEYVDMDKVREANVFADDFDERLDTLYQLLKLKKVSALVDFASTDGYASLLAASQIAPVQVYYSMGYHYMDGPSWDAFFCVGSTGETSRTYEGRCWRTVTMGHQDLRALPSARKWVDEGHAIAKKRFSRQAVVLGAIARPQKLDSEEFLAVLTRILKQNSNAVFLWFGQVELETVRKKMITLGISDQCLFEGFQGTSTYAQVLDIHLDPFPFPSGLSILDTMCYGVPSVFMNTNMAFSTGVPSHIFPLLRRECGTEGQQEIIHEIFTDADSGESLALLANSVDEYVALTQRLIDDQVFRKKVGHAGQRFMETFMLDPKISYESFSQQILEVIEEKKAVTWREGLACPSQ